MKKNPQKISKIKTFIDQYNWQEIVFPSHPNDRKKSGQNNKTIALNIVFVPHNTEKKDLHTKHNFKRENQVNLLMITDGKRWHYLTVESLSALFKEISSNNVGDFYCLNYFHSYRTKNKLKEHERVCNDHDYCYVEMPNKGNKILKFNNGEKALKASAITYAELESLLKKMHSCQNNDEKSYREQKN